MSEITQKPMSSIAKGSVLMVGKPVFAQATELSTKEILNEVRKLGNQKDFLAFENVSMHVSAWDMLQNFIVEYYEKELEEEVPAFLKNRSVESDFVKLTFDEVVFINEFLDENEIETETEVENPVNNDFLTYKAIFNQASVFQDSGLLEIGKEYIIYQLNEGDDFTNVGYEEDGVSFVPTGTTPTTWTNNTQVLDIGASQPVIVSQFKDDFGDVELSFKAGGRIAVRSLSNPFYPLKTIVHVLQNQGLNGFMCYEINEKNEIEITSNTFEYSLAGIVIEFYP
jgi:hypothetical protein